MSQQHGSSPGPRPRASVDELRRRAVADPAAAADSYLSLAGDHFGAFPVARARRMLRWFASISGVVPGLGRTDNILRRIEATYAHRMRVSGLHKASVHMVEVAGRKILFVVDDPAAERFMRHNVIGQWPYEVAALRYMLARLRRDDVFVDVGAHAGYFSVIATAFGAVAYAIEPQRDLVRVIERNAALNGAERLHILTLAVSDREGMTSMIRLSGSPDTQVHGEVRALIAPTPAHRHADWVPVSRLDRLFTDQPLRPRIVKIDIEGLEMRALAGAAGLIALKETAFMVELHPRQIAFLDGDLDALAGYFGGPGWRVFDISGAAPQPIALAEGLARARRGAGEADGRVTLAFEPAGRFQA